MPSGFAKIGDTQFTVRTNAVPTSIDDLNNIPIKYAGGATVFVKDIGQVHDGNAVQQNVVRTDGHRSVLLSIIKNGNASTLAVVKAVKDALVTSRAAAPPGMTIKELFDQSIFVKASIVALLKEGAIAGVLTAMMIILFLGSPALNLGGDLDPVVDPHLAGHSLFRQVRDHKHHADAQQARVAIGI